MSYSTFYAAFLPRRTGRNAALALRELYRCSLQDVSGLRLVRATARLASTRATECLAQLALELRQTATYRAAVAGTRTGCKPSSPCLMLCEQFFSVGCASRAQAERNPNTETLATLRKG